MKNIFVFVGESGSGKTTIIMELIKKYPNKFKKIVTYTSRSKRVNEINGVDYFFYPGIYFIGNQHLVLTKETSEGAHYGTRQKDLYSNTHNLLLTSKLTGIPKLINFGFRNIILVRISISKNLKAERMRQRGDDNKTIFKRIETDNVDRVDVDIGDIKVINLNANQKMNEKINIVLKAC